jgi:hypothetical protein
MAIVEHAAAEASPEAPAAETRAPRPGHSRVQGWKSVEQIADEARRRFPKGTPSSVAFIRSMRDSRHGDDPAI